MLRLPKRGAERVGSRYALLGLRDLPFPTEPVVNPYSDNPRLNGSNLCYLAGTSRDRAV